MEPSDEVVDAADDVVRGRDDGVADVGDRNSSLW